MMTNRHTKKTIQLTVLLLSALLLGSCQNNEDNVCSGIVETAGEPDLTATASFNPTSLVRADTTVDVNVPVDGETAAGTVYLLPVGSQNVADQVATATFTATLGAAEIVPVSLTFSNLPVGTYYPAAVLCDSLVGTCTVGAGYVEDISGFLADTGNYVRGTANGGTVDLSSLIDSCIIVNKVEVTL